MNEAATPDAPCPDPDNFDGSFEANRRRQFTLGLELEPVERLRWLERTMAEMRTILGRAKP